MSFTLMRSNLHEWEDFIRLAAQAGVDIVFARHLEVYTPDMEQESLLFAKDAFNEARQRAFAVAKEHGIQLNAEPDLGKTDTDSGHKICAVAWDSAVITGNGDVAACCVPRTTIGNLHETPMQELWNGPVYQEFRRRVNSPNPPPQCAACPMKRQTSNINSYLPVRTMPTWVHPRDWAFPKPVLPALAAE